MHTTTEWVIVAAVAAIIIIGLVALLANRTARNRHAELRHRFGPEYERAIKQHGSIAGAERELQAREKRVHGQRLRSLPDPERTRFAADWNAVQTRFVDDPSGAVQDADALIKAVMLARGYSAKGFEQSVDDLSVEYANVVQHYRAAHVLAEANREGRANTEELRQAVVHYRALFAVLLGQPQLADPQLREAHA